jgi:hypothetical protein
MHKSATKCNETIGKWCKNKHGASKIIDTFETYHYATPNKPKDLSISNVVTLGVWTRTLVDQNTEIMLPHKH